LKANDGDGGGGIGGGDDLGDARLIKVGVELDFGALIDPIRKAADRPKTRPSLRMNHSLKIK